MRWSSMTYVVACGMLLAVLGQPALSAAQGKAGVTDLRTRSGYSIEELAQALFPATAATPVVRTRGIGPPQARPSLPTARPTVTLNVPFASNADTIPSLSYAELDKLGTVLSWPQYTDYRIQLEGHTDSLGAAHANQVLSERRVQSIKDYLIQNFQITSERVRAVGYGEGRPIASNDTPEGRSQNRRVEVVNLGRER